MSNYQIIIGSPLDYDELVAYIWINDEQIALVHKEKGPENIMIHFFDEPIKTNISIDVFIEALQQAKKELLK
jgi:hypothetical protein